MWGFDLSQFWHFARFRALLRPAKCLHVFCSSMATHTISKHSQLKKSPLNLKSRLELRKCTVTTDKKFEPKWLHGFEAMEPCKFFFGEKMRRSKGLGDQSIWKIWVQPTLSQTLMDPISITMPLVCHQGPSEAAWTDLFARASNQFFGPNTGGSADVNSQWVPSSSVPKLFLQVHLDVRKALLRALRCNWMQAKVVGSAVDPLELAHTASEAPPNKHKFLQEKLIFERRFFGSVWNRSGASDRPVKNERIWWVLSYGACGVEGSQSLLIAKYFAKYPKKCGPTPLRLIFLDVVIVA